MAVAERQDRIDAEAAQWLARQRLAGLSAREGRSFDEWKAADPRHRAAFDSMSRTLADVAALDHLAALEPLEAAPRRMRAPRMAGRGRRIAAGLAAVAAVAVAVVAAPGLLDAPDLEQATAVAEIRPLVLADGSRVTLGARSRLTASFDGAERRVKLTDGEAFFEVAHDPARPFFVETGGAVVRVVGTKFDVKRVGGRVEVAVLEGVVQVRGRKVLPGAAPARVLKAGQQVAAVRGFLPATAVGQVQAVGAAPGGWRQGQLTYDDTRLAELVADLNRYYAPGVRLDTRGLGEIRLAASFKAHEIEDFLRDLPAVADVSVTREPDGAVVIGEAPGA